MHGYSIPYVFGCCTTIVSSYSALLYISTHPPTPTPGLTYVLHQGYYFPVKAFHSPNFMANTNNQTAIFPQQKLNLVASVFFQERGFKTIN